MTEILQNQAQISKLIADCTEIFKGHLERYDRPEAVKYAISLLKGGAVTVPVLYEQILAPALNGILVIRDKAHDLIWREHAMTSIVRSIVESSFPFVLLAREKYRQAGFSQKVLLACPEEEYHEMGLRMGADFFYMAGYDVTFIGSNTPKSNIVSAAKWIKPDIIDISVSNYLNLIALEKIIGELKRELAGKVKILVSGSAFLHTHRAYMDFGADGMVNSFADILNLRGTSHEDSL